MAESAERLVKEQVDAGMAEVADLPDNVAARTLAVMQIQGRLDRLAARGVIPWCTAQVVTTHATGGGPAYHLQVHAAGTRLLNQAVTFGATGRRTT